ncbi:RxLR effector protein [Phytophthora megakarya]|uniref:RxLR effector protein n=1 Tax=Phytophthora megakarya TaxID=4795 RepID=A0A225V9J4_9STRA|nr:RxLR effector protein [Phytophthora megakarya]
MRVSFVLILVMAMVKSNAAANLDQTRSSDISMRLDATQGIPGSVRFLRSRGKHEDIENRDKDEERTFSVTTEELKAFLGRHTRDIMTRWCKEGHSPSTVWDRLEKTKKVTPKQHETIHRSITPGTCCRRWIHRGHHCMRPCRRLVYSQALAVYNAKNS